MLSTPLTIIKWQSIVEKSRAFSEETAHVAQFTYDNETERLLYAHGDSEDNEGAAVPRAVLFFNSEEQRLVLEGVDERESEYWDFLEALLGPFVIDTPTPTEENPAPEDPPVDDVVGYVD